MVRLTGALSNQAALSAIEQLSGRKAKLLEDKVKHQAPARPIKLRQGLIQAAALEVLASHNRALRGKEIYLLVEARLGRKISRDTVYSYLSVASRCEKSAIRKVGYGRRKISNANA